MHGSANIEQHKANYFELGFEIKRYREMLLKAFQLLSIIYRICENRENWSKTVDRRAISIFENGFSHPVDPEFQIFLSKDNLHKNICP